MNPKILLNFLRDLIATAETKDDALCSIACMAHLYLDVFHLKLDLSQRKYLIGITIALFESYASTRHGSNKPFESGFSTVTIKHVIESLLVLTDILKKYPEINVERLSSDAVENFFAATNQRCRNQISITEKSLINTARRYYFTTWGEGVLFGNRYRDLCPCYLNLQLKLS